MFLQEWLEFPQDSYWSKDQLRKRVRNILGRIQKSVFQKETRSFWVPEFKLFNFRARSETKVSRDFNKVSCIRRPLMEREPNKQQGFIRRRRAFGNARFAEL